MSIAGVFHSSIYDPSVSQYGYQNQSFSDALDGSATQTLREMTRGAERCHPAQPSPQPSTFTTALVQIQEEDSSSLEEKDESSLDPDPYTDYIHGERILV